MPISFILNNMAASSVRSLINSGFARINAIDATLAAGGIGGIQWTAGNTLPRVEADLSGETYTLVLRASGTTTADPASPAGHTHWSIENRGTLAFYPSIGPYLSIGQLVMFGSRMYQLLNPYISPPTPGSDNQWKDIFADASSGTTGGGIDPVDPGPVMPPGTTTPPAPTPPDGTPTIYGFADYDLSQVWYQVDGASGQAWSQSQLIAGYTGQGYVTTNNQALGNSVGTADQAQAFYHNFNYDNENDKKAWIRVHSTSVTGAVGAQSRGNGTLSLLGGITPGNWQWMQINQPFRAYDQQFLLRGITPLLAVDKLLLTDTNNPDVPTGELGFYQSV